MSRQFFEFSSQTWAALEVPPQTEAPELLALRMQAIPPRSFFPMHAHAWGQFVHATSGVLNVSAEGRCFVVPPDQAVWLPQGTAHAVGSLSGAEFRSLYVAALPTLSLSEAVRVLVVSRLLRELIAEAAHLTKHGEFTSAYGGKIADLIVDCVARLEQVPFSLPWPASGPVLKLCETLYEDPSDPRDLTDWASDLGLSSRTLARRCERDLGMSLRSWRRALRIFRAIDLLSGGANVTETALMLGYSSVSAFIQMFRESMGCSPARFAKQSVGD